jgi:hypothetical protein
MRNPHPFWQCIRITAAIGLILCFVPACKPAAKPAAPAKPVAAKTSAMVSATNNASATTLSTFEQLLPPKGRDPFFPNSHRRDPVVVKGASADRPAPAAELVLKGVVGSATHRLALINDNTILEVGEEGSVRVANGHVHLRCLEIGEDYAVVKVEGEIQTKRLQLSKKSL